MHMEPLKNIKEKLKRKNTYGIECAYNYRMCTTCVLSREPTCVVSSWMSSKQKIYVLFDTIHLYGLKDSSFHDRCTCTYS